VTLIGLDPHGMITGTRLLEHSEPILLVGIPEQALHDFIAFYLGKPALSRIVVGSAGGDDALRVDVISGATVTALAQNQTILRAARTMGVDVGVIDASEARPGRFLADTPWSWSRMEREGVFGRLSVSEADMGVPDPEGLFVDLWFTIADAPHVGRALLGDTLYRHLMGERLPGEHLFVVLGNGSSSFKGSAFVRGGIFDRVRVRQGMRELVFRDTDYENLPRLAVEDAPAFKEGAVFFTRGAPLDPGASYELVFLGSRYDHRGAYSREFHEFVSEHRLPRSVYRMEGGELDEAMYVQAWRNRRTDVIVLSVYLLAVIAVFAARRWSTGSMTRIGRLHVASMIIGFVVVGLYMGAQPSVTQILTLFGGLTGEWRWDLFLSAPLIFLLWIFIFVVSLLWGRGVFCGWVCPYGALTELVNKAAKKLRIPQYLPPRDGWHRWIRYAIFFALVAIYLVLPVLAEKLAEVEPFKTTFLVAPWARHWGFVAWWVVLLVAAVFVFRPFCRYICPLGAGLALFGSWRLSGPRRRAFCSRCTICAKGCEPEAIRPDGTIDPRECLSCMECETNYRDREVCPPLVGLDRLSRKVSLEARDRRRLEELTREARTL
jgi:NosR/NirI family transcriptional regulator, nitrous oxide reductase regulator